MGAVYCYDRFKQNNEVVDLNNVKAVSDELSEELLQEIKADLDIVRNYYPEAKDLRHLPMFITENPAEDIGLIGQQLLWAMTHYDNTITEDTFAVLQLIQGLLDKRLGDDTHRAKVLDTIKDFLSDDSH